MSNTDHQQNLLTTTTLRIAGIIPETITDGDGFRASIYVQGCPHKCEGCHNAHTHDFNGGEVLSLQDIINKVYPNPLLAGLTFSGGEPFCQAEPLAILADWAKQMNLNIWCYSGYTLEELKELAKTNKPIADLLSKTDTLVDGKFIQEQKDLTLRFRGSKNQRIIDLRSIMNKANEK